MLRRLNLHGHSIMNGESREGRGATFYGIDPATGERLEPVYRCASLEDLNLAADLADEAFAVYRQASGEERARFLRPYRRRNRSDCAGAGGAGAPRDGAAGSAPERRVGADDQSAAAVCAGGGRGLVGECAHRSRAARSQAAAAIGHSLDDAAAGAGCRLWREQFSAGVLSGRRRHGCCVRGGISGDREGAPCASGDE